MGAGKKGLKWRKEMGMTSHSGCCFSCTRTVTQQIPAVSALSPRRSTPPPCPSGENRRQFIIFLPKPTHLSPLGPFFFPFNLALAKGRFQVIYEPSLQLNNNRVIICWCHLLHLVAGPVPRDSHSPSLSNDPESRERMLLFCLVRIKINLVRGDTIHCLALPKSNYV